VSPWPVTVAVGVDVWTEINCFFRCMIIYILYRVFLPAYCLHCFDAVGWGGRKGIRSVKKLSDRVLAWLSDV